MAVRILLLALISGMSALAQPAPDGPPMTIPETVPASPYPSGGTPYVVPQQPQGLGPSLPSAPPAPSISMLLLVPQDVSPGQPVPYVIKLANNSQADAGKVSVRMPIPAGAAFASAEPMPTQNNPNELVWDIKSLPRGETRKIEVKLNPGRLSEMTAKAYVSYEFGQAVKTRISAPKLKVTTELPKEITSADEMIPVRVRIENNGRVPVEKVKLTETISVGFEYHRDTEGEKDAANPLVRTWDLGTIPAGMGRTVEYRVMPRGGRDLLVRSNVDGAGQQDSHDAKVKIQDAKLKVELRGDPQANDDTATYRLLVKNEGSTTLTNIRVVGSVPQDCRVTSRTNGGQLGRDSVQWVLPKLAAGDSYLLKWDLKSSSSGRKTVRAEAVSDRGLKDSMDVETIFAGAPALNWETRFEQPTVALDRNGMFTVKLVNSGSEPAKNAKVTVTLPDNVSFVQATPTHTKDGNKIVFESRGVKAGSSETFSVTFRGERPGQAYFSATLVGEGKSLNAEKYVQITSR